ncbi:MAG: N-acetylglucosaminyl transferase [Gammaproteobacteria bacterium]|nr:N-acetylglucosaminyl transferase [Gammaproteobacteria bacterium]
MDWTWILIGSLVIFAGWYWWSASRWHADRQAGLSLRNIPPEYLKGLNYVLNEQQDKAIEIFIKMLEVDSDTVETHLALGHLFRRRGETDRAIRIHQNLIARPNLGEDERLLALLELGMDYMSSGLLDRAESLFKELSATRTYAIQAHQKLLEIYQQEKEWDKAIVIAQKLQSLNGQDLNAVIAQFYCELADQGQSAGNTASAQQHIRKALTIDPDCIRASLLEGKSARREGKTGLALKTFQRVEKQDPDYLPEVIAVIVACYRDLGQIEDCMQYLRYIVSKYGGMTPLLHLTRLIEETHGEKAAVTYISQELKRRPSVRGVDKLIEYALAMAEGEIRDNLQTIKEMTGKLLSGSPVYKCEHCGFDAKLLHWHCPSCKQWSTIKPVLGVVGE